jgi:uncharacterized protein YoxC
LVKCGNITIEEQINCKTRNMVNDLLREQIPVYWITTNVTASVRELTQCNDEKEMIFKEGGFVITFTGNKKQDTKLTAIVCDYNQSSKIESENSVKIPVYLLMGTLDIQVYQLSEVKIAEYKGLVNSGCEHYYLEIARKCGFLTFEYLEDKKLAKKLNNRAFNVIMFPAPGFYLSFLYNWKSVPVRWAIEDVKYGVSKAVRGFVATGGGCIGSCAGADRATSGMKIETQIRNLTIDLTKRAYNPKLCSIGFLAISDVIIKTPGIYLDAIQSKIFNNTNPVTYGLEPVVVDWLYGGPQFLHIGKNSQIIALFHNTNTYLDETPSWLSSQFGNGKVVIFSTHPEITDFKIGNTGKTIISNALYYTTSNGIKKLQTFYSTNLSFIKDILKKTSNLKIDINNKSEIFERIKIRINGTINEIKNLSEKLQSLDKLIRKIADEKNIDLNKNYTFLGNDSVNRNLVFLDIFIEYFRNTTKTIDILEEIYPLLEKDTKFIEQIESLKTELLKAIKETRCMCIESQKIYPHFYTALLEYQQAKILLKFKENVVKKNAYAFNRKIPIGFYFIPQTYFNSLKLLRTSWYNYEVSVTI